METGNPDLRRLLERRTKRSIAAVLNVKEREADFYLPTEVAAKLRKVILDTFNDQAELMFDLLSSIEQGSVVNELWLDKFDELTSAVNALVESNGGT